MDFANTTSSWSLLWANLVEWQRQPVQGKQLFHITFGRRKHSYLLASYTKGFEKAPSEPAQQLYQEKQKLESSRVLLERNLISDPGYQRTMQLSRQLPARVMP